MAFNLHMIELHVCFDRSMFGPDSSASVTFSELNSIVSARDSFAKMSVNHRIINQSNFSRSLVSKCDLPAGHILTKSDLTAKKPSVSGCFNSSQLDLVLNNCLTHELKANTPFDSSYLSAT